MSDNTQDLDALFDEISSQHGAAASPAPSIAPAPAIPEASPVAANEANTKNAPDAPMYDRLGGIVRQLHESLKQLGYDQLLAERAGEIADSKGRLEHIATLTEKAANTVLNAVDASLPEQDRIAASAKDIEARWSLMLKGKLPMEQFQALTLDSKNFASNVVAGAESEKARLMEIMMAQDFQDITGQIIKKVVAITQNLERDLAQMLRDYAHSGGHVVNVREKPVDLMAGPDVPSKAMVQDAVDDLLADLGF
jgi:chemotaxis protein CheZ